MTDAAKKASAKYNKSHYEQIQIRVKSGDKETIQAHAAKTGESLNAFINRAISETMYNDGFVSGRMVHKPDSNNGDSSET